MCHVHVPCGLHRPAHHQHLAYQCGVSGSESGFLWNRHQPSLAHPWLHVCRQLREPARRCHSGKALIAALGGLAMPSITAPGGNPQGSVGLEAHTAILTQRCRRHPLTLCSQSREARREEKLRVNEETRLFHPICFSTSFFRDGLVSRWILQVCSSFKLYKFLQR